MDGYKIDVAKILARDICDRDVSKDTKIDLFFLLIQIF